MDLYRDPTRPLSDRIADLLRRMTLTEKVGQLNQKLSAWNCYRRQGDAFVFTEKFTDLVARFGGMGALYGLFRADPWSRVTFENGIPPERSGEIANQFQKYVKDHTRLGIPLLITEECPHGHQALDGTLFPTNLGMGATFDPELYRRVMARVAAEIRGRGGHLGLVSALDMLRDPRWGRSEECYGEDPFHGAAFADAATRGLQGDGKDDLRGPNHLVAILKHFCAQGAGSGGHNAAPAAIGERELREIHLKGMDAGIRAGALGCMAAYNEIDGVKCHGSRALLTDRLRGEMGFQGIVMADGGGLGHLTAHLGDAEKAAALGLQAGVDLSLWDDVYTRIEGAVKRGLVAESVVDEAVARILKLKFLLGLFENPYVPEERAAAVIGTAEARDLNLDAARKSLVLLKNDPAVLPFDPAKVNTLAVLGPNADALYNQLGDYTSNQRPGTGVTVRRGLETLLGAGKKVIYARGCGVADPATDGIQEAVDVACRADAAVLVLGGSSTRDFDIRFDMNGAAIVGGTNHPSEMNCGEGVDVSSLELSKAQIQLFEAVQATGKPLAVVLIQGRPHAIPLLAEKAPAILCAWYPGKEGGTAVAEALFGAVNPGGKCPVSIPRSVGQLPVCYNLKESAGRDYVDGPGSPLYPFGHGLSYTVFTHGPLAIQTAGATAAAVMAGAKVTVTTRVTNAGPRPGDEVVQLYVRDREASVVTRVRELKGFARVTLAPGESREVTFQLGADELAVWDANMVRQVEPGNFDLRVGGSSAAGVEGSFELG